jgi:hypothetical protein
MILKGYYCDKQARLYGGWEDLRIRWIKDKRKCFGYAGRNG